MATPPRSSEGSRGGDPQADVRAAASEARRQADAAKEKMGHAGEAARTQAAGWTETARHEVEQQVERQKEAATESIHDFAEAVKRAGDDLANRDQTTAARLVKEAAGGLEGLSRSLSRQSPEDMLRGLRDFGRQNPTAFIAGSILAGLALGRFAQSSGRRAHSDQAGHYPVPSTGQEYQVRQPGPGGGAEADRGSTPTTSVGPGPGSAASVSGIGPGAGN